jgi:hypothetical protein
MEQKKLNKKAFGLYLASGIMMASAFASPIYWGIKAPKIVQEHFSIECRELPRVLRKLDSVEEARNSAHHEQSYFVVMTEEGKKLFEKEADLEHRLKEIENSSEYKAATKNDAYKDLVAYGFVAGSFASLFAAFYYHTRQRAREEYEEKQKNLLREQNGN